MKILFYNTSDVSETKGGTERITARVSQGLTRLGHQCYLAYSVEIDRKYPLAPFVKRINIEKASLEQFLVDNDFDVVIMQKMTRMVRELVRIRKVHGLHYKIISVLHFNPGFEEYGTTFSSFYKGLSHYHGAIEYAKDLVRTVLYPVYRLYYPHRNRELYQTVYKYSDRVVLLSRSFISQYAAYARLSNTDKFVAIPNANSYDEWLPVDKLQSKKKQVLVVSRLEERLKRISLAIKAWAKIEKDERLKDWNFKIVGDGSDRGRYEQLAKKLGLERVSFEGRQKPKGYYEESSIFLMTSAYEGWGLTLTEAQQMGCVPIVFDSFSAVHDIIKSGENGLLIPNNDLDSYVSALVGLMLNEQLRKEMERQALRTSKAFALQEVIKEWGNLLSELPTQYV
jgi:glycosyltransferase involved in cell wall biosynthesis